MLRMSYLVLARKYRPRGFAEMVGQEHVVRALGNALNTQRLHHAYLFTGTRGVGKTTVARILAKSLNCTGPQGTGGITAEPCGVCQSCTDIDNGRFVDYTELDAASNRGVDEVQALLEQAVYKPVQGRFKVFMIDEVHMLSNTAFNAMLKTLEEPPDYLKFVLATTDPQKVPVTVLSRCLQFNLRPMAPETVLEHLIKVLQAENVPSELPALRLLARAARGSMRDALSLTDQAIAFGAGKLEEQGVRQMLGSVDHAHVFRLIEALALGDGKAVVEISETLRLDGLSAASTLEEMTLVLQRMAVLQALPEQAAETDPDAAETARLAALMPQDETQLLYSLCLHGIAELGLAPDEYAALTMVLLRLLAFKPQAERGVMEKKSLKPVPAALEISTPIRQAPPTSAPADRLASTPASSTTQDPSPASPASIGPTLQALPVLERPQSKPLHAPSTGHEAGDVLAVPVRVASQGRVDVPKQNAPANPLVLTEEGAFWHELVAQLISREAINALVRELALQSQLVARDGEHWLLRVESESLNSPNNRERLQTALRSAGHQAVLSVEVGRVTDSPAKRLAEAAAQRQSAAEKVIYEDPFVQTMMRDFGAKIVPGSIKPLDPNPSQ